MLGLNDIDPEVTMLRLKESRRWPLKAPAMVTVKEKEREAAMASTSKNAE